MLYKITYYSSIMLGIENILIKIDECGGTTGTGKFSWLYKQGNSDEIFHKTCNKWLNSRAEFYMFC